MLFMVVCIPTSNLKSSWGALNLLPKHEEQGITSRALEAMGDVRQATGRGDCDSFSILGLGPNRAGGDDEHMKDISRSVHSSAIELEQEAPGNDDLPPRELAGIGLAVTAV
jgi:hypothetical protein